MGKETPIPIHLFQGLQETWQIPVGVSTAKGKYFLLNHKATLTRLIKTGTSIRGPMTAAKAWPESIPKTATATAMASSKLFDAAVKLNVVDCSWVAPASMDRK